MKLAITGALGHIGSRFIHSLQPGDFEQVLLLDNLSTQRYCSLFNLPGGVPFKFIEADIFKADLEELFSGSDVVLHLAAIADATGSFEIQDQVERINYEGTQRVSQACVRTKCRLIFVSSTSVYGTERASIDEACLPEDLRPQSPYAQSKLNSEEMLRELGQREGLMFAITRFGTIFGVSPGMRFHTAVNRFVWQACMGKPLTVWSTAMDQKRPYLDLVDAVNALRFILDRNLFDSQVYNVLTGNFTVRKIVGIVRSHIPDIEIEYVDAKIMNQLSYDVLTDKFKALGFGFAGSLEEGIAQTVHLLKNAMRK